MKIGDKVRCIKHDVGLTIGEEYKITAWVNWFDKQYVNVDDKAAPYCIDYFEAITTSLEDKIKLAKSYIGKRVIAGKSNRGYVVTKVDIVTSEEDASRLGVKSDVVEEQLQIDGIVVVISNDGWSYPIEMVKLAPISKTVKLNDKYEAVVYVDKIVVGCQTFPISILDDLKTAHYSIS